MDLNIDDEWAQFLSKSRSGETSEIHIPKSESFTLNTVAPICGELNISTTTKVLFINQSVDINEVFWKIPIMKYEEPSDGIIKKQMKIVSHTQSEFDEYKRKLENVDYYSEHIIKRIDNPSARRIKFKDERKITVGVSKKDIMNCRGKVKNAFYNCFAMILRFHYDNEFREIHVKIFNTGKMEIPGIVNDELLNIVRPMILSILTKLLPKDEPVEFVENDAENNVLINSNFNCGYYINREKLYSILRSEKYKIETAYDPCSYPGVKCKFYFNHDDGYSSDKQKGFICRNDYNQKMDELGENKKYTEVSFMIFRTGSCLIVGNCTRKILDYIYEFIKNLLYDEYSNIMTPSEETTVKVKQQKIRKKNISVTKEYMESIVLK
tara:strand:- start:1247 stop:2386 length:1140 start_codon:yes stop_codon:yes gene_type:complete